VPALLARPLPAARPPLWDGRAGERAADEIERMLGVAAIGGARAAAS
jgi:hypothetical protein